MHADSSAMKVVFPSTSKAMGITVPVYRLQVISRVPVSAVCDSTVFGMVQFLLLWILAKVYFIQTKNKIFEVNRYSSST